MNFDCRELWNNRSLHLRHGYKKPYMSERKVTHMKTLPLITTLLAVLLGLGGCAGNYKTSDDDYRPLGDPQAEQRAK